MYQVRCSQLSVDLERAQAERSKLLADLAAAHAECERLATELDSERRRSTALGARWLR